MTPSAQRELEQHLDTLVAQLQREGHATPYVEVASWTYRWMRKHLGPVRGARRVK